MWYSLDTLPQEDADERMLECLPLTDLLPHDQRQGFTRLFRKYIQKKPEISDWGLVQPPSPEKITPISNIEDCPKDQSLQHELLNILAIVKLNGGLGAPFFLFCFARVVEC
jgi:UDP-N-acetylglucosamine pyrophosphorylase